MTKLYGQNEEILESYNFRAERVCLKSGSRHGGHTGLQYFFISKLRDMHSLLWPWHSAGEEEDGTDGGWGPGWPWMCTFRASSDEESLGGCTRTGIWEVPPFNCLQGCRGDWILMPIPIPYPQKNLWESPQNPHIHRIPKSSIPVHYTLCIFVWCIYHFIFLSCMPSVGYVVS